MEEGGAHSKISGAAIHVIVWALFLALPLFFMWNRAGESIDWGRFMRHCVNLLILCAAFYLNYFILIPHLLFKGRRRCFFLANAGLALALSAAMMLWQMYSFVPGVPGPRLRIDPVLFSFMRDFVSIAMIICLSALVKMGMRWQEAENARREAEKSRSEAELKNLRNQLNPHFLLNTLNNIYALIPIDADSRTPVAPLIFISLIENAFKHGISPVEQSRIRIFFEERPDCIVCDIRNSYHPKAGTDKSGFRAGCGSPGA